MQKISEMSGQIFQGDVPKLKNAFFRKNRISHYFDNRSLIFLLHNTGPSLSFLKMYTCLSCLGRQASLFELGAFKGGYPLCMQLNLKFSGHCVRHQDEMASQLVLWEPLPGKRARGRP